MKKGLSFVLGVGILLFMFNTAHSQDFWTGEVADSPYNFAIDNIRIFDWSSSGSGNAEGMGPVGTPLTVGDTFTFRYQSYLINFSDPVGDLISLPGLNDSFEYTIVAEFPEIVSYTFANTALFSTMPGGKLFIYYDNDRNGNVSSGLGFDDGTLVASGSFYPDQISVFTAASATEGVGSFIIEGAIDYINGAFLNPNDISGFRIEGTVNIPPIESTTDAFFVSRGSEGNLDPYPVAPKDLAFKVDASHRFMVEEEEQPGNCRVTAGGVKEVDGETVTFICSFKNNGLIDQKSCASETLKEQVAFKDTWGGQAGASGIDGNWTHHHDVSPKQSFVFHSNEVDYIECSDPGVPCTPAGANATNRQIDFQGIGSFSNQKGYSFPEGDLCYTVHLEDIGEPGPGGKWPSSVLPCTHVPGSEINNDTDCMNCTDYYEIRIFDTAGYDANGACTGTLIYANGDSAQPSPLGGYFITSGNVQMHPAK